MIGQNLHNLAKQICKTRKFEALQASLSSSCGELEGPLGKKIIE